MSGPVLALIVRMAFPPFLLAVPARLTVHGICLQLAAVIVASPSLLALFPTAHALLRSIAGGDKEVSTVGTFSAGRLHASYI
jgi:hypothetical protein